MPMDEDSLWKMDDYLVEVQHNLGAPVDSDGQSPKISPTHSAM